MPDYPQTPVEPDPQSAVTPVGTGGDAPADLPPADDRPEELLEAPPQDTGIDYRQRYSDSVRGHEQYRHQVEAERQQLQYAYLQLQQQLQQQQQALAAQQQPRPGTPDVPVGEVLTDQELTEYNEAVIGSDLAKQRRFEQLRAQRVAQHTLTQVGSALQSVAAASAAQSAAAHEAQALSAALARYPELNDPIQSMRFLGESRQIELDPAEQLFIKRESINVPGVGPVNPYALIRAVEKHRMTVGTVRQDARDVVSATAPLEGAATRPGTGTRSATTFSYMKHLSEPQREYVKSMQNRDPSYTHERYWKNMDESERAEVLRQGRPLTPLERRSLK